MEQCGKCRRGYKSWIPFVISLIIVILCSMSVAGLFIAPRGKTVLVLVQVLLST